MDEPLNMRIIRDAIYLIARSQGLISATEADSTDNSITSWWTIQGAAWLYGKWIYFDIV